MAEHTSTTPTPTTPTAADPLTLARARRAELAKLLPAGVAWGSDVGAASLVRQRVESLPSKQVTHTRLVLETVELSKALAFCWEAPGGEPEEKWAVRMQDAQRIHAVVQLCELLIAAEAEQAEQQEVLDRNDATTSNS